MVKSNAVIKSRTAPIVSEGSLQAIGSWAFLLGVFVAFVTGALLTDPTNPTATSFLVILGTIVGLLNVTTKETNSFLMAAVSLVLVSALGGSVLSSVGGSLNDVSIGTYLSSILNSILIFVVPATIVVALKSIFALAEKK